MAVNSREGVLLILALSCIGLFVADRFIFSPLADTWKARSERIVVLEQDLNSGDLLMSRQRTLQERWEEMRERSLSDVQAVAENNVLTAINDWKNASRLNVTALRPRWIRDEEFGNRLEIRVTANGDMRSIAQFLYELERDPLALALEDVQITSRNENGSELALETRFTGLVLPTEEAL